MTYMHNSVSICHGSLKSTNCLINERFNVKITDYGLNVFPVHPPALSEDESHYRLMLWTAPEILRGPIIRFRKGTKPGDVYSYAIIMQEILTRSEPFRNSLLYCTETPKGNCDTEACYYMVKVIDYITVSDHCRLVLKDSTFYLAFVSVVVVVEHYEDKRLPVELQQSSKTRFPIDQDVELLRSL